MVETSLDRKALAEVYNVLIMLDKENFDKIPKKMIEAIKNNMDTDYEVEWSEIEKGNLLEDTEKILSVLYTDYLATPEEKNIIMQLENLKYKDCYPVFKNRVKKENINEEKELVEVKNLISNFDILVFLDLFPLELLYLLLLYHNSCMHFLFH